MKDRWEKLSVHVSVGIIWGALTMIGQLLLIAVVALVLASVGPTFDPASGIYVNGTGYSAADALPSLFWWCVPVVLATTLVAGFGGWFLSRLTFAPMATAVQVVNDFGGDQLETRLTVPEANDERREVVIAFNSLLDRLHEGFADGSRFAANASHELRTPLAASRTIIQVALKTPRDEDTTRVLERLLLVNGRMIGITGALLDLASAENDLVTEPVELRVLVADTIALLEPEISERHLRLHLRLDDVRVIGHRDLLRQLVTNLIRNAIVHNVDRGSLAVTLHGGSSATLAIENDGSPIEPERIASLTQPFARLENRTHAKSGSGLGLTIAARIVDAHDAELTLTARPRGGMVAQVFFNDGRP